MDNELAFPDFSLCGFSTIFTLSGFDLVLVQWLRNLCLNITQLFDSIGLCYILSKTPVENPVQLFKLRGSRLIFERL